MERQYALFISLGGDQEAYDKLMEYKSARNSGEASKRIVDNAHSGEAWGTAATKLLLKIAALIIALLVVMQIYG
jgi:hypothetical protein